MGLSVLIGGSQARASGAAAPLAPHEGSRSMAGPPSICRLTRARPLFLVEHSTSRGVTSVPRRPTPCSCWFLHVHVVRPSPSLNASLLSPSSPSSSGSRLPHLHPSSRSPVASRVSPTSRPGALPPMPSPPTRTISSRWTVHRMASQPGTHGMPTCLPSWVSCPTIWKVPGEPIRPSPCPERHGFAPPTHEPATVACSFITH